jgi:hypothetical protein
MRELVLQMGVSIDGYVATVDGAHDWGYDGEDPATTRWKLASLWGAGAHLMGRQTYEDMAGVWPKSSSDVAAAMNEIPKVVFSKTLERAEWPESQIAAGKLAHEVARLKAQEGGYLLAHAARCSRRPFRASGWSMSTGSSSIRRRLATACPCSRICRAGSRSNWSRRTRIRPARRSTSTARGNSRSKRPW